MGRRVAITGFGQTHHSARRWDVNGLELIQEAVTRALADAQLNLKDIDAVVFDIQDVGARFYTYISTLHYMMEACAENDKFLIVLDRPNPNGFYVDGPILDPKLKSGIGINPIPIVHG